MSKANEVHLGCLVSLAVSVQAGLVGETLCRLANEEDLTSYPFLCVCVCCVFQSLINPNIAPSI